MLEFLEVKGGYKILGGKVTWHIVCSKLSYSKQSGGKLVSSVVVSVVMIRYCTRKH